MILMNWQRNIYRIAIRRIRSKSIGYTDCFCVRIEYGFGTYDLNDRVLRACVCCWQIKFNAFHLSLDTERAERVAEMQEIYEIATNFLYSFVHN